MSNPVVFVIDDPDRSHEILDAWEDVGVKGITILESTGLGHVRQGGIRDDLPLIPSLGELYKLTETHNRTMFSVVLRLLSSVPNQPSRPAAAAAKANTGLKRGSCGRPGLTRCHTVRGNSGGISLRDEDITVGEVLKEAGYATGAFGKWGVGDAFSPGAAYNQGFDAFVCKYGPDSTTAGLFVAGTFAFGIVPGKIQAADQSVFSARSG